LRIVKAEWVIGGIVELLLLRWRRAGDNIWVERSIRMALEAENLDRVMRRTATQVGKTGR
jgi:hypothetical protein